MKRVLIYSHDSFGLGHLRRCQTIAQCLVDHDPDITVLMLSGSSVAGQLPLGERVDFVRFPGVVKRPDGEYITSALGLDIDETIAIRSAMSYQVAKTFAPDLFIVDKEPLGLRGELRPTLELLREQAVPMVLGLRDVLDAPSLLASEWQRKQAIATVERFYDQLWVYGLPAIWQPLVGVDGAESIATKMIYTGYLRRRSYQRVQLASPPAYTEPFILITPGGGGDGEDLVDQLLCAYEADPTLPRSVIVLGVFMHRDHQEAFARRARELSRVELVGFTDDMESLMEQASGVVAMGGYNTFCEILSFDKRALIIPRKRPRQEQWLRATQAEQFGLCRMLSDNGQKIPLEELIRALHQLPQQPRPSQAAIPGLLDGLDHIVRRVTDLLAPRDSLVERPRRRQYGET